MKYLVNRKTKEHTVATREDMMMVKEFGLNSDVFALVEADSEGWIAHTGKECPLPDDVRCEVMFLSGEMSRERKPLSLYWGKDGYDCDITHYKPIPEQAEKVQEPDYDPRSVSFNLLDRLKAAHKAAQTIPDLEAELREVLGSMGYDLVVRNPFVDVPETCFGNIAEPEDCCNQPAQCWEPCGDLGKDERYVGVVEPANSTAVVVEPKASVETTQDMSDWRDWRDNDLIMLKDGVKSGNAIIGGELYQITHKTKDGFWIDTKMQGCIHIMGRVGDFRFHSRPARGE